MTAYILPDWGKNGSSILIHETYFSERWIYLFIYYANCRTASNTNT